MSSIHLTIHGLHTTIITHERDAYVAFIEESNQETIKTYLRNKGLSLRQTRSIDINNEIISEELEHSNTTQPIKRTNHGANLSITL
jgi:hypothetical protein